MLEKALLTAASLMALLAGGFAIGGYLFELWTRPAGPPIPPPPSSPHRVPSPQ